MMVVTILYPRTDESTFDIEYYTSTHMPMLADAVGAACHGWGAATIARGPYAALGWMSVTTAEAFDEAMASHGAQIIADVPNYTNVKPEMLIGEYAGGSQ